MSSATRGTTFRVPARFYGLVAAALGLVLLGTVIWVLLRDYRAAETTQATDFSAIPASVNVKAPQLSLGDLQGHQHALADYRGSVVVVNLWATWCPPCQAEMPNLETFYKNHRADGLVVVGINDGDPSAQVSSFVARYGLTFPVWLDPTYQATDHAFKTGNLPTSFVLDRTGQIRLMWVGAISEENLEKHVTPLVEE